MEFAQQINTMDNAWGVVRCVLDIITQKDGAVSDRQGSNKQLQAYDIPTTHRQRGSEESSDEDPDNSTPSGEISEEED